MCDDEWNKHILMKEITIEQLEKLADSMGYKLVSKPKPRKQLSYRTCKECKWLDLNQKTSVGYVCTNPNDIRRKITETSHIKGKANKACKVGFEPREE